MSDSFTHRPTYAEINLDNLAFNLKSIKKFIGEEIEYMAVVKADAYGHGAVACAKKLESEGINWLGIALPEEGLELRENGINSPILCLGSFWEGQENLLLKYNITPVVYQLNIAEKLNRAAQERNVTANVHIKIDTGMGRIGVRFDEVKEFAQSFRKFTNLHIEGLMTHFAAADDLDENEFTNSQINKFNDAVAIFEENGFRPKYKDLANSPGAVAHPNSRQNLVRIGGILYGLGDDVLPKAIEKPELKPVLSLHSRIAHLKRVPKGETLGYGRTFQTKNDSLIATVPIGYEDGYRRSLSNRGRVIIDNQYVKVVGRISMDWITLDVSNLPNVNVNDEVILIGNKQNLKVTAEEIAQQINTISYEVTCGINRRVRRTYVGGK
jgi:alanine racemase